MVISPAFENYLKELSRFEKDEPEIGKKIVTAGAQPVADEIRNQLNNLPDDTFRHLKKDEEFTGLPDIQWKDLSEGLGIAKADIDNSGNANTKVGFKGYGSHPTKKYPNGLPNALLARAVESGSSVRKKTPFVRPAVNKSKSKAIDEMQKTLENEIKIYAL
jgi:HK97 gp10 family phage protein